MTREFKFFEPDGQADAFGKKFETIHVFENPIRDMERKGFYDENDNELWSRRLIGVRVPIDYDREIKFYEKSGANALGSMDFAGSDEFHVKGIADKVGIAADKFRAAFFENAESETLASIYEIALFGYFVYGKYESKFKFFGCRLGTDGRMLSAQEFNEVVWEVVRDDPEMSEYFFDLDRIDSKKIKTVDAAQDWMMENGCNTRHGGFNCGKNEKWKDVIFVTTNKKGEVGFYWSCIRWDWRG